MLKDGFPVPQTEEAAKMIKNGPVAEGLFREGLFLIADPYIEAHSAEGIEVGFFKTGFYLLTPDADGLTFSDIYSKELHAVLQGGAGSRDGATAALLASRDIAYFLLAGKQIDKA